VVQSGAVCGAMSLSSPPPLTPSPAAKCWNFVNVSNYQLKMRQLLHALESLYRFDYMPLIKLIFFLSLFFKYFNEAKWVDRERERERLRERDRLRNNWMTYKRLNAKLWFSFLLFLKSSSLLWVLLCLTSSTISSSCCAQSNRSKSS